jgi:hypothetical protein
MDARRGLGRRAGGAESGDLDESSSWPVSSQLFDRCPLLRHHLLATVNRSPKQRTDIEASPVSDTRHLDRPLR